MLSIEHMTPGDLDEVMGLEQGTFSAPWTRGMYLDEIGKREGCYFTARSRGSMVGYGGALLILDEAHVMTLAVERSCRRMGIGTRLLLHLMREAEAMGARFFTLEVRKSNHAAIGLYSRFGFQIMGERKNYYLDNMEHALIMWTEDTTTPEYQRFLEELWRRYGNAG